MLLSSFALIFIIMFYFNWHFFLKIMDSVVLHLEEISPLIKQENEREQWKPDCCALLESSASHSRIQCSNSVTDEITFCLECRLRKLQPLQTLDMQLWVLYQSYCALLNRTGSKIPLQRVFVTALCGIARVWFYLRTV